MRCFSLLLACLTLVSIGCDSGAPGESGDPSEPENDAPTANFSFTPQDPRAGQAVTFTANATDPDGEIVTYSWDFDGDGTQDANGASPTYEYTLHGNYTPSLTVTDDDGATERATHSINVSQRFNQATVTSVTVMDMPFTDQNGAGWDVGSGPDVYFASFNGEGENITVSNYFEDVAPGDLPIMFNDDNFTISDLSERFAIAIYDYDPINDDDFIGGIEFDLADQIGTYSPTLTLDAGAGIVFEITLDWSLGSARTQSKPPLQTNRGGEQSSMTPRLPQLQPDSVTSR